MSLARSRNKRGINHQYFWGYLCKMSTIKKWVNKKISNGTINSPFGGYARWTKLFIANSQAYCKTELSEQFSLNTHLNVYWAASYQNYWYYNKVNFVCSTWQPLTIDDNLHDLKHAKTEENFPMHILMFQFTVKMQPETLNTENTYQTQQILESQDWLVRDQHHFLMVQIEKLLQSARVTPLSPTHRLLQASPAAQECRDFFQTKCLSPMDLTYHPAVMPAVLCECPPTMTAKWLPLY